MSNNDVKTDENTDDVSENDDEYVDMDEFNKDDDEKWG